MGLQEDFCGLGVLGSTALQGSGGKMSLALGELGGGAGASGSP